ncbi:ATP-binding protein [Gilliamella apicola]|uniref:ATP-binding protein n=1 Tax=Gilliamella apicola TaxID=1196095 RepID=UPI002FEE5DA4
MALEAGGFSEKIGHRYEANWIAYQLLLLLEEKVNSVIVEPIGNDEVGVDVLTELKDGQKRYYQCKSGAGNSEYWTLPKLNEYNILKNALFQIQRDQTEYHLISPLPCKKINDLRISALNSNNPKDFLTYQINASKERKKDFNSICQYLNLDAEVESDLLQAINFLQKFHIIAYDINTKTIEELKSRAGNLFMDDSSKLITFLKNYPEDFNKLRQTITATDLLTDLKDNGFEPKIIPDDDRISTVISSLSDEFQQSIEPFLIGDTLIKRGELTSVINSIESHAITLISAEAGSGKSALLLELHNYLTTKKIISVPIRLDRRRPENNIDDFGKSLGFPYCPIGSCSKYSSQKKIVFILDQLDAIRWTGTHSSNALEICRKMVDQVQRLRKEGKNISIVLASRDFDLNEDIALSKWLESVKKDRFDIKLTLLDEDTIKPLISFYEPFSSLSTQKQEILKIPLWLGIYLTIAQRNQKAPQFSNKLELIKKFLEDRLNKINRLGINEQSASDFINKIVSLMTGSSQLSISEHIPDASTKKQLDACLSVGLLSKQNNRISFRHQVLFDYYVGLALFQAGIQSPQTLLNHIGNYEEQTLTKREHLKYALIMLLDYSEKVFCNCAEAILFNNNIRFHLKILVLNTIKEIKRIKQPIKLLIDKILETPELFDNFLNITCVSNITIISCLCEQKIIENWLKSDNEKLINHAIQLLRSTSTVEPDLIINNLTDFIGQSNLWNQRVYSTLPLRAAEDSDELFEFRKQLFNYGYVPYYIDWNILIKIKPLRAFYFLKIVMEHYKNIVDKDSCLHASNNINNATNLYYWNNEDIEEIKQLSQFIPNLLIELILNYLSSIFKSDCDSSTNEWLIDDRSMNNGFASSFRKGLIIILENSGKQLYQQSDTLFDIISPYMKKNNKVITHLIAKLLLNLSPEYADQVISWLLESPNERLMCGNGSKEPIWLLSGELIRKFSPFCCNELFRQLEEKIYNFPTSKNIEEIKRLFKLTSKGANVSYWGELQYFLLPTLDKHRISAKSKQLIGVLDRKFSSYIGSDFYKNNTTIGGFIRSPLPKSNKLSNKEWRKIVLSSKIPIKINRLVQITDDLASEASIRQFSGNLKESVTKEPYRFAKFALTLPRNIDPQYIDAIFDGLVVSNNQQNNSDEKETCPISLIEQVIFHFNRTECEDSLVQLIESRAENCSRSLFDLLINLTSNSSNPEDSKLTVTSAEQRGSADKASANVLTNTMSNCVQRKAYLVISKIFEHNQEFALQHLGIIDNAINDNHPAVNIAAVSLLAPLLNYNDDYAHQKFIELCHKDLRMTCANNAYRFFNQGFETKYRSQYIDLTIRMVNSHIDEVKELAGKQIYARWFFNDLFIEQKQYLLKDTILKKGCASMLCELLRLDNYNDKIHKIENTYQLLLNDNDTNILKEVSRCINDENYWKKPNSNKLFELFITSKAAIYCFKDLVNYLNKTPKSLLSFGQPIFKLLEAIVPHYDKTNFYVSERRLVDFLKRLYDEAVEDENGTAINTCLDIWDKLLKSDFFFTKDAIDQLNTGLLN